MNVLSIPQLDAIYGMSGCRITRHRIHHPAFRAFSLQIKALEDALGEDAHEASWRTVLGRIRRYNRLCSACPLPFASPAVTTDELIRAIGCQLVLCRQSWPGVAGNPEGLLKAIEQLRADVSNPLLDFALNLLAVIKATRPAFLVWEGSCTPAISAVIASAPALRKCMVLTAAQLRHADCYDVLVVFGPTYLYPDYVFTAPRAQQIECVRYAWQGDRNIPDRAFSGGRRSGTASVARVVEAPGGEDDITVLEASDLLPQISWTDMVTELSQDASNGDGSDCVQTKGLLLEGGLAVLLECSEGSQTLVIDLDAHEGRQVVRIPTRDIEPGMFVLLRTSGGGDYIKPLADLILGQRAGPLRAMQADWKVKLQSVVAASGVEATIVALQRSGSGLANPANLRNWLSSRNIRPANLTDFAAIMKVIGDTAQSMEYWQAMSLIDKAHRKAGFRIRKMLLGRVRQADLAELEQSGRMDFELADADGGRITAFRVTNVSGDEYQVSFSLIGRPFDREEAAWLA